jgi:prevent-host-death family protein
MRIASVTEIKARFSAYLKASAEGPIIVTRHGKPVAVLLSVENEDEDELERLMLAYSPRLRAILNAARQQIKETGGVQHQDFWREMETSTQEP